jgi:hypothetical protein
MVILKGTSILKWLKENINLPLGMSPPHTQVRAYYDFNVISHDLAMSALTLVSFEVKLLEVEEF